MGQVRYGVCALLEERATALLLASLEGVTNREHKADIMTPWKEKHRKSHEILTTTGAQVDPSTRRGQFTKAYNPAKPQLNSRDCPTRPMRISSSWDPEEGTSWSSLSPEMAGVFGVERIDSWVRNVQVGDVGRSQTRYGPLPMSVRHHCPVCRCYVTRSATSCRACGTFFVSLTPGYAQVTSVGQR